MRLQVQHKWKLTLLLLVIKLSDSGAFKRCSYGLEYGEDCAFVPAPPGRTPNCAAPGFTYCEQPDYYPKDLIRHLVQRGEYDISTLLSDETRDDFGATSGPYGYGPHSIPGGVQGISLVTERPNVQQRPRFPPNNQFYNDRFGPNNGGYNNNQGPQYNNPSFQGPVKEDPLPPPPGYVGYYKPSYEQRAPPYLPPPPPPSNHSGYRGGFLDDNGWRNGDFFPNVDYSNGPRSYYSTSHKAEPGNRGGQAGWATTGSKHHREQYAYRTSLRQTLTPFSPEEWWQRYSYDSRRADISDLPFKSLDSNDLKPRPLSKRETRRNRRKSQESQNRSPNPAIDIGETYFGRKKRQAPSIGGEQLCPTRSQYIMPRAALNKEGNWMYVVNMENDSTYSQLVKSEVCVSTQCNGLCSLPVGYSSKCEQKYVQKRLVALDQGGQRLYTDIFWFPSCCLCTITNNQT